MTVEDIRAAHASSIAIGPFGSRMKSNLYTDDGVPVIRGTNLSGGRAFVGDFVYVSRGTADDLRASNVFPDDLVFPHRGAIGSVGIVPREAGVDRWMLSTSLMKLTCDPTVADPLFMFYFFRSPSGRAALLAHSSNVGTPGIAQPLTSLKSIQFSLPRITTQRKIAAVLSTYDDLLENNNRRIKLLEELAQRIHREWFVDFRYPGHESVPLVDSVLGPVPQHWKVMPASDALEVNPKIAYDKNAARSFAPMTSLSETMMHIAPLEKRVTASGSRFENGDTLFARITPCLENGKTGFVQCLADGDVASGSTEFIVLRGRCVTAEFVYLLARSNAFRDHAIKSMSGATGRQRVRETCFDDYLVPVASDTLLSDFSQLVGPMFALSYKLFSQNQNLRTTHNLLLPGLISGDIDVDDLNIEIPEAA